MVVSAAEAETHGIFENAQTVLQICFQLQLMGHPQPHIPLKTNNMVCITLSTSTSTGTGSSLRLILMDFFKNRIGSFFI